MCVWILEETIGAGNACTLVKKDHTKPWATRATQTQYREVKKMASRRYQLITRVKEEGQADFRPFKKQSWGNLDHAKREVDFWCTRLGNMKIKPILGGGNFKAG